MAQRYSRPALTIGSRGRCSKASQRAASLCGGRPHPASFARSRLIPGLAVLAGAVLLGAEGQALAEQLIPETPPDDQGDITEQLPGSGAGDITETIGGTPQPESAPAQSPTDAAPAPEKKTRFQASGYVRQSLELVYGEFAQQAGDSAPPTIWRDVFVSRTQLMLRASYVEERHFEATVSGLLSYTAHVAKRAPYYSQGVVDLVRGEVEPELREAYLGFFWPAVELRVGQQRVAWGRADFQSPNDVINARDLRDPFLTETELRYLPTPVMRASVSGGAVTFETVASPFFVPDRFDVVGSNWSAIQIRSPLPYQAFVSSAGGLVDDSVEPDLIRLFRQTARPKDNGKGAAIGARLSANLSGTDLDAYYHYGYDSLPYVQVDPGFAQYATASIEDFRTPGGSKFAPVLDLLDEGVKPISAHYIRRHHAGFDVASVLGSFVLRLDAAYESKRVFYKMDLTSFAVPTVLGVAGIEYQTGNIDDVLLVEVLAARMLDAPPPDTDILAYERNTAAVAGTLRWGMGEEWGIDLRALVGLVPRSYALQPALRFKPNDSFTLRLGALILSGEENSFGWYFGDNDSAFVQLKWAF